MKISKACASLALACVYWRLADEPRPLTSSSPAEDSDPAWDAEADSLANEARRLMARVPDHATALRVLRDRGRVGDAARLEARRVVAQRFPSLGPVAVHAFGPGCYELGSVTV